jgi:uncharacterized protein (UPF0147 family)
MSNDEEMSQIVEILVELVDDSTVPRNVKDRIGRAIKALSGGDEVQIRVDKALEELEEISNDTNLQSYTRAQIWNIVSMLESL